MVAGNFYSVEYMLAQNNGATISYKADIAQNAITILSAYSSLIPILIKNELQKLKLLFEY